MIIEGNHMIADEGKTFIRIVSGEDFGSEIYLGYSHYIGGVKQDPPHKDIPEDFEEVDIPEEENLEETEDEINELVTSD